MEFVEWINLVEKMDAILFNLIQMEIVEIKNMKEEMFLVDKDLLLVNVWDQL